MFEKIADVGVLAFATVDAPGNPQVRNISAIHYEPEALYFFTARGKDFCRKLSWQTEEYRYWPTPDTRK